MNIIHTLLFAFVFCSTEVPTCDMSVMMGLVAVLSPECQGVLMASVMGGSDNSALSCDECACYMTLTPEGFLEATGVDADSCGAGSGYSFMQELDFCTENIDTVCQDATEVVYVKVTGDSSCIAEGYEDYSDAKGGTAEGCREAAESVGYDFSSIDGVHAVPVQHESNGEQRSCVACENMIYQGRPTLLFFDRQSRSVDPNQCDQSGEQTKFHICQLKESLNGEDYCESDFMLRNEESCKASSCCHWNTWEDGEGSFNGQGRCWSDIGTEICTDMSEVQEMEKEVSELPFPPGFYPDQQSCYDCDHRDACNCGVCGSFGGCSETCKPDNWMFKTQPGGEKCTKQWCEYCPASQPDECNCGVCGSFGNCGVSCHGGNQAYYHNGVLKNANDDQKPVAVDWFKSLGKPVGIPCVICWEELPIEGSEDWWSCRHSNTYTCNGGDSCCCNSGWQPTSDGSCSDRCDVSTDEELSANTYDALNAPLHSGVMYFLALVGLVASAYAMSKCFTKQILNIEQTEYKSVEITN